MPDETVTPLGHGAFRIGDGMRSSVAYAVAAGDVCWVFLDGRVYVIEGRAESLPHNRAEVQQSGEQIGPQPAGPGASAGQSVSPVAQPFRAAGNQRARAVRQRGRTDEHGALSAPMPATVVSIIVDPGQRVSKGDVLIMLEAMKMELPIRAPRDAVVKAIACRPGELVQPGVPLLELE